MGWTLASLALENDRAAAASLVGTRAAAALFPDDSPIQEPIQPNGQRAPRLDFTPLPPPGAPRPAGAALSAAREAFFPVHGARGRRGRAARDGEQQLGGVAAPHGGRTRAAGGRSAPRADAAVHLVRGAPRRAGRAGRVRRDDPGLAERSSSASIATSRGRSRTRAPTCSTCTTSRWTTRRIPRATGWTAQWRPVERRVERYRDRSGATIATDTLYFTHRGPMRRVGGRWMSMRWTVLEGGTEIARLPRRGARAERRRAAARVRASGTSRPRRTCSPPIAAGTSPSGRRGAFPSRPGDGSGQRGARRQHERERLDGGRRAGRRYPQSLDPAQGYLASANQQPIDPRAASGWWGGSYDPWRAMRINTLLRADSAVTPDAMRRYQTDPGSARADYFVPYFLDAAQRVLARARHGHRMPRSCRRRRACWGEWDRRYTRDNRRAVLFEAAMQELATRTWDELAADRRRRADSSRRPRRCWPSCWPIPRARGGTTAHDRGRRASRRHPRRRASSPRSRRHARATAIRRATAGGGIASGTRNVNHLLRIPALSARDIPVAGGPETLAPSAGTGTHGASWRMVVELGPERRAWATYPGGQSGNPLSDRYRDRLGEWSRGELEPLRLPASAGTTGCGAPLGVARAPTRTVRGVA